MDSMTVLVIWIGAALLSYAVARKKGRDPVVAIAMGLLLGFFALIYYMLAKGSKEYEVKRAKEIVHDLEESEPEKNTKVERNRTPNKHKDHSAGRVILLIIGGFIGIFAIGAIASALSNKSGSNTPAIQDTLNYQIQDSGSLPRAAPRPIRSNKYPDSVRNNFLNSCIASGEGYVTKSHCTCMLENIESKYTLVEYAKIEQQILKTGQMPSDFITIRDICIK